RFDEGRSPIFHIVSRGSCWLEVEAADGGRPGCPGGAMPLAAGDFVLLPHGHPHRLRNPPGAATPPISALVTCTGGGAINVHRLGGGGAQAALVGGCFRFEHPGESPLVECLPPVIHVKSDGGPAVRWVEATLRFMATETASNEPGTATVVSRLADILFV